MCMPAPYGWTVDEVLAFPEDGNRYEVVDGELLVTPSPRLLHQDVIGELYLLLRVYLRGERVGHVLAAPADIIFGPRTLVQPDVFVAPLIDGRRPREWKEIERLLLAVEVLSPASARADRAVKRRLYQRQGVPDYWVVDVDARLVERWTPADERPEIITDVLEWRPDPDRPSFSIDLPSFFAELER